MSGDTTPTERRTVAYLRVSTTAQDVEVQAGAVRRCAETNNLTLAETYADRGVSGRTADRPEFNRLRADIQAGRVGCVVVARLDRLARSVVDLLGFYKVAESAGCRVLVSDQAAFDSAAPSGKFLVTILGAVAELEASLIRSRVTEGMRRIRETGVTRSGRPNGRPRRVSLSKAQLADSLHRAGKTWAQVAVVVGLPKATARRAAYAYRKGSTFGEKPPSAQGGSAPTPTTPPRL